MRWSESAQRWMAWVRFPDGSRRKVERVQRADAERYLDELLALRAEHSAPEHRPRRQVSFAEVLDAWFEAGCPNATPTSRSRRVRVKSPNTVATAGFLLDNHVRPKVGRLAVDRTTTERLERVFGEMATAGYATSTIDRTWLYLSQACQLAVRQRPTKSNPAADVLLPPARPAKVRKTLTIDQARWLLVDAIRTDAQPAMWLTGLMCGLRPGELAGLRWPYVDLDGTQPMLEVAERALEVGDRYSGQAAPKTDRGRRRIGLHPLLVAALIRHRHEQQLLGLYDDEGFVFCTRNRTPHSLSNLRRGFRRLCAPRPGWERTGPPTSCATRSSGGRPARRSGEGGRPRRPRGHQHHPGLPPPGPSVAAPRHRGVGPPARLARPSRAVIAGSAAEAYDDGMSVVHRPDEPGLRLFAVDDDALWDSRPRLSPAEFAMEDVSADEWDAFYAALTEE